VAPDMGRLKTATAGAAPQSHALQPSTVKEALAHPDASEWVHAMKGAVQSCLRCDVWKECELPAGEQALPSRFVFEQKRDGCYKARSAAGGQRQQHGLDFAEAFAPVCWYWTMCMLFAVSAHENLVLRQFDIRTACVSGELEEEVSLRRPSGAEHLFGGHKQVLRLQRALCGLKQASRAWKKRLESELRAKEFEQSDAHPALWISHGKGGAVLAMFYVDDGLVAAKTVAEADALVDLVGSMFEIRKIGEPDDFLGIHICRCPGRLQAACVSAGVLRPALRADVGRVLRAPWGPSPDAARGLGRPGRAGWWAWPLSGRLHLGGASGA
jgi:hypothetical protein